MEERNSSHFEGDQSSTSGSSENRAELCPSLGQVVLSKQPKLWVMGHEKREMMEAFRFLRTWESTLSHKAGGEL